MNTRIPCLAVCSALILACDPDSGSPPAAERAESNESPIINGTIDADNHSAIAFTQSGWPYASCSGSIIKVEGSFGWALTAAHCTDNLAGSMVSIGHLDDQPRQFPIVEVIAHPDYDPDIHSWWNDYGIVRFIGADATVPVVPAATPAEDNLVDGVDVTLVGYGRIEGGGSSMQRRSIDRPLEDVDADTFKYDQATGGICFGDSGGPAFADLPAGRRVVGVTTVVSGQGCEFWGGSARASHVYDSFIEPMMNKPTFDACSSCFGSALGTPDCQALLNACFTQGTTCESYANCLSACNDAACQDSCATAYPTGKTQYDELAQCPCGKCGSICDDEPVCGGPALGCGITSNDSQCQDCIDGCCTEARDCTNDGYCYSCFPNCDANPAADALLNCLEGASCVDTCGLLVEPGSGGGGGGTGGSGSAGTGGSGSAGTGGSGSGSGSVGAGGAGGQAPVAPLGGNTGAPGGSSSNDDASNDDTGAEDGGCTLSSHTPAPVDTPLALVAACALAAWVRRSRM